MSVWSRKNKTAAFGVVNNSNVVNIGGKSLPAIDDENILVRDDDGTPRVVIGYGRRKYKIELVSQDATVLVAQAQRALRTWNATFHHSIMPQNMADAIHVLRHMPYETSTEMIVDALGIVKPPSITTEQFDEMVRAWYWHSMSIDTELTERCRLTTEVYRCFGWMLDIKLSGKRKS